MSSRATPWHARHGPEGLHARRHDFQSHHRSFFLFAPRFYPGFYDWYGYPSYSYNYSPGYYSYYYSPGTYDYGDGSNMLTTPVTPVYPLPSQPMVTATEQGRIEVILPDPAAEVWVEGQKTTSTGTDRLFTSPPLEPGKTYAYTVTAAWSQAGHVTTQERTVDVVPGTTTVVDFTKAPAAEQPVAVGS